MGAGGCLVFSLVGGFWFVIVVVFGWGVWDLWGWFCVIILGFCTLGGVGII